MVAALTFLRISEECMLKKYFKYFNSVSTKVIFIIFVLVLPLNIIALAEVSTTIHSTIDRVRTAEQNLVDVYTRTIEMRMDNTVSLLNYFRTEDEDCIMMILQSKIEYPYESAKMKFYNSLQNMAEMTDGADGYFYYMHGVDDILVYSNQYIGKENVQILKSFVSKESEDRNILGWHIYERNDIQYMLMTIELKNVSYGAWIILDPIREEVLKGIEYQDVIVTFGEAAGDESLSSRLYASSNAKNIHLTINISRSEILRELTIYQWLLIVIGIVYILLIPVLYLLMHSLLIKPLSRINYAHRQMQTGNQDYRLTDTANSQEYIEAFQSFNIMADNLNSLRIEAYEKEIARHKMELQNLQMQIKPHFLSNTFNLLYTLAQRNENESIQEIVIYLSEYFRYIFRSEKELELFAKELELIKGYSQMASIRYLNMIKVTYDFEPEIEFVRTPPLLIHNFVENAVKHGVRKGVVLHIVLQGIYEDKTVRFIITDDGKGMDKDVLERNQKMFCGEVESDVNQSHLGLYNSMKRLKYFYGEEAKIEVDSEPGEMTCFIIQFPYDMEEDDESFNGE